MRRFVMRCSPATTHAPTHAPIRARAWAGQAARALAVAAALVLPQAGAAQAQEPTLAQAQPGGATPAAGLKPEVAELIALLQMPKLFEIMQSEGADYGDQVAEDMFPVAPGGDWDATVAGIYAPARVLPIFEAAFAGALETEDTAPMRAFFAGDLGRRAVDLEVSAREALLDPEIEDSAKLKLADMMATHDPRVARIEAFAEAGNLIEANVAGGLNANLAFWHGLIEGGGFQDPPEEADILSDVWSQAPAIREETRDWLLSFLNLAYQPLSDAELDGYIAFSATPAGATLNRAIFTAFDAVFVDVSRELGRAAGRRLAGQDI